MCFYCNNNQLKKTSQIHPSLSEEIGTFDINIAIEFLFTDKILS